MSDFEEAMQEIGIGDDASKDEKMKAVCQWILGSPDWWGVMKDWMHEAGVEIEDYSNE